jgi:hypothetical protein
VRETIAAFRMAFLPLVITILAWGVVGGALLGGAVLWAAGLPAREALLTLAAGIGAGEVAGVVLGLAYIAYFRVHIGRWGVRAFDAYGLYHETTWEDITAVRPLNFLGLRFLRAFRAGGRRPLWLPMFLSDMRGFTALVREHAGPVHVLARGLLDED